MNVNEPISHKKSCFSALKNGYNYVRLLQKAFFGTKITDTTTIDCIANGCLTTLHHLNNANIVDVKKEISSYKTKKQSFSVEGGAVDYTILAVMKVMMTVALPIGVILKAVALLNTETKKRFLELVELQYEELRENYELSYTKQDNAFSQLPNGVQKLIFEQLNFKDLSSLHQTSKQWAVLTKKELYFKSLNSELQKIFGRCLLAQTPILSIKHHRSGFSFDYKDTPIEYFVQAFDSDLPSSPYITIDPTEMKDKSLAHGRDLWNRPYLALHLVYEGEKVESVIVLQPKTPKGTSRWQAKETFIGKCEPKNSLGVSLPQGFTHEQNAINLLKDLIEGKTVILSEGDHQSLVRLYK